MKLVYICSPFAGDGTKIAQEKNIALALDHMHEAVMQGNAAIAPHTIYPRILDDTKPNERQLALDAGLVILEKCDEMWVYKNGQPTESSGMKGEIAKAKAMNMPIRYMD